MQQGLFENLSVQQINRALLLTQPAHLQALAQEELSPEQRDERRAALVHRLMTPE